VTGFLFSLTFVLAAPFWALMILAPRWWLTRRIVAAPLIALPPLVVYALVIIPRLTEALPVLLSPTLPGMRALLGTASGAAAAWAHFIAFDLFVGRWMYLDSRARGIHPLAMAPVLVLTILLAPLGLLTYLLVFVRFRRA